MAEKPILFSGPMVRAILDGRKTQTRRLIKFPKEIQNPYWTGYSHLLDERGLVLYSPGSPCWNEHPPIKHPYAVGDRLWVREAWRTTYTMDRFNARQMLDTVRWPAARREWAPIQYEADGARVNWDLALYQPGRYRNAQFMPRWASRLNLLVTEVRAQRVQDISEEDAQAEGIWSKDYGEPYPGKAFYWGSESEPKGGFDTAKQCFACLWDFVNGPDAWERNDWVWAYTVEMKGNQ